MGVWKSESWSGALKEDKLSPPEAVFLFLARREDIFNNFSRYCRCSWVADSLIIIFN